MPDKKVAKEKIHKAKQAANSSLRFNILRMPEDKDDAPHWLFTLLILVLIALIVGWIWESLSVSSSVQAYLPYL